MTLNIQLIFVFDGPGVPAKRGRNGGRKIDYERLRLLKQLLRCFGIPYQEAPGEAEAECARLQILGLVDAVWSQDSDCLMFGCSLWIHDDRVAKEKGSMNRSKENTKKNDRSIRVVRARDMKEKLNLDREGLVLFAMLVGGDYHATGLPGCGAGTALKAVKDGNLAQALCSCRNQRDCLEWSFRLAAFLQTRARARNLAIPANFPDYKILQKYYRPKVTSDELLKANKSLELATARPIDQHRLLEVTSSRFNIWGRLYLNWVGPVLLTRSLSQRDTSHPKENLHDIRLTKQRANKSEEFMAFRSLERKITFSPFGITALRRDDFEGGEREGMWEGKRDVPFDSTHRVECDYFPAFWLQKVFPPDCLNAPPPAPQQKPPKRKAQTTVCIDDESSASPAKKKFKSQKHGQVAQSPHPSELYQHEPKESRTPALNASSTQTQKPQSYHQWNKAAHSTPPRPHAQRKATTMPCEVVDLSDLDDDLALRLPPAQRYRGLSSLRKSLSHIVDLGSPESSADESEELSHAIHLSMQSQRTHGAPDDTTVPGSLSMPRTPRDDQKQSNPLASLQSATDVSLRGTEDKAISVHTDCTAVMKELDQIRAARLRHFASSHNDTLRRLSPSVDVPSSTIVEAADCIDLTEN